MSVCLLQLRKIFCSSHVNNSQEGLTGKISNDITKNETGIVTNTSVYKDGAYLQKRTTSLMLSQKIYSPDRRQWLRTMLLIRSFEDKVQQLFMQGLIPGTTHLCQGHEAVEAGAINIGTFDEGLNMESVGNAPVVFICENNF